MKNMQQNFRVLTNMNAPTQSTFPAISVIIPLYNTEKYIGECLESLLFQTFKNFEVIVVDDCSTDSSPMIVESYIPRFDGRLKLVHMKKNSGGAPAPRNKGFSHSRGEYILFMDSDDEFIQTALEEFYTLAKDFNAEVVYTEKYYAKVGSSPNISESYWQKGGFVDKPTFESENLAERVQGIVNERYSLEPWNNLIRRELIADNEISFPALKIFDDEIWTYNLVFSAKKYLRVPRPLCIHRFHDTSNTGAQKSPSDKINFLLNPVILGFRSLDEIMGKHEFFVQNPQYRYAVLEKFINGKFNFIFHASLQLQPFAVYETIKQGFSKNLGEHDGLVAALCTIISTQQKISIINQQRFDEFIAQSQKELRESQQRFQELAAQVQLVIEELEQKNK